MKEIPSLNPCAKVAKNLVIPSILSKKLLKLKILSTFASHKTLPSIATRGVGGFYFVSL